MIGGRSGAGKSTVAHALHAMLIADDVRHAVIDGDALDLAWPRPWEHRLSMRNLAAVWANYRELGYRRLVYVNTVAVLEAVEIAAAMGDDPAVTRVLLTATDDTARQRLEKRETGPELREHLERSLHAATALEQQAPPSARRIVTDGRDARDIGTEVRAVAGW